MTADLGITSTDVLKRYGSLTVLNSVSFAAPRGKVTLLAGRNGTGKTTWIRIALGLARADAGSVRYGQDSLATDVRRSIAAVFDEPPLYPNVSGFGNLRILSGRRALDARHLTHVREVLGLDTSLLAMRAGGYSLGQRRRIATAAALLRESDYLFLDEPTIGLDPIAWHMVRTSLRMQAERGAAVLLTGQDFSEIETVVDRVAVLAGGGIVFEGDAASLRACRPPRVRAVLADAQNLAAALGRPAVLVDPSTVEVPCADDEDANAVMRRITNLSNTFTSLQIERDSLEQAFLAIHARHTEDGGENRA